MNIFENHDRFGKPATCQSLSTLVEPEHYCTPLQPSEHPKCPPSLQREKQPSNGQSEKPKCHTHFRSYQVSLVKRLLPVVQLLLQVALLPAEQVLQDRGTGQGCGQIERPGQPRPPEPSSRRALSLSWDGHWLGSSVAFLACSCIEPWQLTTRSVGTKISSLAWPPSSCVPRPMEEREAQKGAGPRPQCPSALVAGMD